MQMQTFQENVAKACIKSDGALEIQPQKGVDGAAQAIVDQLTEWGISFTAEDCLTCFWYEIRAQKDVARLEEMGLQLN